jgi:hypothetical protein
MVTLQLTRGAGRACLLTLSNGGGETAEGCLAPATHGGGGETLRAGAGGHHGSRKLTAQPIPINTSTADPFGSKFYSRKLRNQRTGRFLLKAGGFSRSGEVHNKVSKTRKPRFTNRIFFPDKKSWIRFPNAAKNLALDWLSENHKR